MFLTKPAAAFLLLIAATFCLLIPTAGAQQNQNSGSGLQISPTRNDITIQPGERKQVSITLRNITQNDVSAQVFLNDFESDNNSGTPKIIVDSTKRTPFTLDKMLLNLNNVELKAGETKEVKLTLAIPANASPGAYFGALRYAAVPKGQVQTQAERQVSLTASVAHLIFVEIPGEVNQQIQIESLQAQKNNKSGSFFFQKPDRVALSVKNLGNGFSRPFGRVSVNNGFGGKEVYAYDVNNTDPRGLILPDSSRNFVDEIKNIKFPGKYNLTAGIAYGDGAEVVTYKSSFIYFPLWAIIALLVLISLLVLGVYLIYRKKFKNNSRRRY